MEALLPPPLLQVLEEATTVVLNRLRASPRHKHPGNGGGRPRVLGGDRKPPAAALHGKRSAECPSSAVRGRGPRLQAPAAPTDRCHVTDGHCAWLPPWWGSRKSPANTRPRRPHAPTAFVAKPSARRPQPPQKGWRSSSSRSEPCLYNLRGFIKQ